MWRACGESRPLGVPARRPCGDSRPPCPKSLRTSTSGLQDQCRVGVHARPDGPIGDGGQGCPFIRPCPTPVFQTRLCSAG